MFIVSKRNIVIPGQDGKTFCRLPRGFVGEVPAWAAKTAYFQALVKDGKIVISKGKKDKDLEAAAKTDAEGKAKPETGISAMVKDKTGE